MFRKVPGKVDGVHMESQNCALLQSPFVPSIVSICSPCEILIVCVDEIFKAVGSMRCLSELTFSGEESLSKACGLWF